MAERIDGFCENLRVKLTKIDNEMQSLRAKIDQKVKTAGQDVQTELSAVKKRIDQDRAKLTAAQNDVKTWMEERKSATAEKIAEWKAKLEKAKLQSYADSAERYAAGAAIVALAAVDQAQEAALEAWLARKEAGTHKIRKRPEGHGCNGSSGRRHCEMASPMVLLVLWPAMARSSSRCRRKAFCTPMVASQIMLWPEPFGAARAAAALRAHVGHPRHSPSA